MSSRSKRGLAPTPSVVDRHGKPVVVGTNVRMLEVTEALRNRIPKKEWAELQTMVGEVFMVYEIDEHGAAWVEKVWLGRKGNRRSSHHYALDSHEMEVVEPRVGTAQSATG